MSICLSVKLFNQCLQVEQDYQRQQSSGKLVEPQHKLCLSPKSPKKELSLINKKTNVSLVSRDAF